MAHLKKLPTYFVKGDERRAAYYTINARELMAAGFVEEGAEPNQPIKAHEPKPVPEILVEVGLDAFDTESIKGEGSEDNLDDMTKAELVEYAEEHGLEFKPNQPKAEILQICKDHEDKI